MSITSKTRCQVSLCRRPAYHAMYVETFGLNVCWYACDRCKKQHDKEQDERNKRAISTYGSP